MPETHSFDSEVAKKYGVDCAVVLWYISYSIGVNKRNVVYHKDGKTWICQTRKELAAGMPYYSEDQIRRLTDRLVDLDLLIKGNYNTKVRDRTLWYTIET